MNQRILLGASAALIVVVLTGMILRQENKRNEPLTDSEKEEVLEWANEILASEKVEIPDDRISNAVARGDEWAEVSNHDLGLEAWPFPSRRVQIGCTADATYVLDTSGTQYGLNLKALQVFNYAEPDWPIEPPLAAAAERFC